MKENQETFDPEILKNEEVSGEEVVTEKLVGRLKPHRGHTVFEFNTKTGKLVKAEFEEPDLSKPKQNKKIMVQKDCLYIAALNLKNAARKVALYHGVNIQIKK